MKRRAIALFAVLLASGLGWAQKSSPGGSAKAITYTLFNNPHQQFLDNSGRPLAGGRLYTYAPGSTTPQSSFSDNLGTLNTNPVVLDSGGMASVYLNTALGYRVTLKNAQNVALWTVDLSPGQTSLSTVPLNSILPATGTNTIANGSNPQTWQWSLTGGAGETALRINENSPSTAPGNSQLVAINTLNGSTAYPFCATATASFVGLCVNAVGAIIAENGAVFTGPLTGNVTGNITGTTGNFSGDLSVAGKINGSVYGGDWNGTNVFAVNIFGTLGTPGNANPVTGSIITATGHFSGVLQGSVNGNVTGNVTGNASTATALATTPTQCPGGNLATGIAANGNANCTSTPVVTSVVGSNGVAVSTAAGVATVGGDPAGTMAIGALSTTGKIGSGNCNTPACDITSGHDFIGNGLVGHNQIRVDVPGDFSQGMVQLVAPSPSPGTGGVAWALAGAAYTWIAGRDQNHDLSFRSQNADGFINVTNSSGIKLVGGGAFVGNLTGNVTGTAVASQFITASSNVESGLIYGCVIVTGNCDLTQGQAVVNAGDATFTGYFSFYNHTNSRTWYMGFDSDSALSFHNAAGTTVLQLTQTGVSIWGTGVKHVRAASCTTAASANANCTTTVSWPGGFADANYTATCSLEGPTEPMMIVGLIAKSGASVGVLIQNAPGANAAGSALIDCIALHD